MDGILLLEHLVVLNLLDQALKWRQPLLHGWWSHWRDRGAGDPQDNLHFPWNSHNIFCPILKINSMIMVISPGNAGHRKTRHRSTFQVILAHKLNFQQKMFVNDCILKSIWIRKWKLWMWFIFQLSAATKELQEQESQKEMIFRSGISIQQSPSSSDLGVYHYYGFSNHATNQLLQSCPIHPIQQPIWDLMRHQIQRLTQSQISFN